MVMAMDFFDIYKRKARDLMAIMHQIQKQFNNKNKVTSVSSFNKLKVLE